MANTKEKYIRPKASRWELGLGEIWEYRELLYFLTLKQVKTKYKQTAIGIGWAVLQPLLTTIVFAVIFYNVAGLSTGGVAPIPFLYAGLMLWTFFATTLNGASMSLVSNAPMVTKVYFPRILLPLSLVIAGLLDYVVAWGLFIVIVLLSGESLSVYIPLVIIPLVLTFLLSTGLSFWMSALAAKYRDVQYIVPFFITILMFASPVLYPSSWVQNESLRWLLPLNPFAGIMSAQRAFIFGSDLDAALLAIAVLITVAVFFFGLLYFKAYERKLADVI
ncbi:MAG: ABC transporter permease, partial [Methanomassiliicoccus sp.]|nr:ABC transporter permease [Methanomassiliicoccus sp.]